MRIIKDSILLGPTLNKVKGNRSMGKSGKVNLAILYRNKLSPEKQTIPKSIWPKTPREPSVEKYKPYELKDP